MNTPRMNNVGTWRLFTVVIALLMLSGIAVADDSDFETQGVIESIGADSLVVNGFIFDVDNDTEIKTDHRGNAGFADLKVGDFVEVEGVEKDSSRYYAKKIERKGNHHSSKHDLKMKGMISELGEDYLTVNNYTFFVDSTTRYEGKHRASFSFADLQVGMRVEVKGVKMDNGDFLAVKIEMEDHSEHDSDNDFEVKGTIDSVLSAAVVINNTQFSIDDQTRIELDHHVFGTLNDLSAGMYVEVKASRLSDGSYYARKIEVENENDTRVKITGAIDSVGTDFLMVLNYTVQIDSNTQIMDYNKAALTLADLENGQRVQIKGKLIAENTILADRIKVKPFHQSDIELTGQITFLEPGRIQVGQSSFMLDSATVILDNNRNSMTADQLAVGMLVEIKGFMHNDGNLHALRIKVENQANDEIELTGSIEALTAGSLTVNGIEFLVDSTVMVFDLQHNLITFADLAPTDLVEVRALLQADGSYLAVRIKLEDTSNLIVVAGIISAKSANAMWIDGPQYQITAQSVLLDSQYQPTDLTQFNTGDQVMLWAVASNGSASELLQVKLDKTASVTTGAAEQTLAQVPQTLQLHANYPNPFNPSTTISFTLAKSEFNRVRLEVYDITGRKIKTLFNGVLNDGSYSFKWNGTNFANQVVSSGVYFYRISTGANVISKKMTLMR